MTDPRPVFVTPADLQARHPQQLAILAADEETRLVDPVRVDKACADASTEIRAILGSRYDAAFLDRLNAESRGVLLLYGVDIALYRVSSSFGRTSEELGRRYAAAVRRLESLAAGKGGLEAEGYEPGAAPEPDEPAAIAPGGVVIEAPGRLFTRARYGGAG